MTSRTTLMELIAKAGGVVPDRGNVAYILRGSAEEVVEGKSINELITRKEPIKVDLESLLDRGDMSANLPLAPGGRGLPAAREGPRSGQEQDLCGRKNRKTGALRLPAWAHCPERLYPGWWIR